MDYREEILDHYKHPRNFGHLDYPSATAEENNELCGDRIIIEVSIKNQNGACVISDIRFSGEGCAIDQASASMLTEKVKNLSIKEALDLNTSDIIEMIGTTLTPSRVKCAVLPLEVLHKAIKDIVI